MLVLHHTPTKNRLVFVVHFGRRARRHVQLMDVGALLAHSQRTVSAGLQVIGLGGMWHFATDHRVHKWAMYGAWLFMQIPVHGGECTVGGCCHLGATMLRDKHTGRSPTECVKVCRNCRAGDPNGATCSLETHPMAEPIVFPQVIPK